LEKFWGSFRDRGRPVWVHFWRRREFERLMFKGEHARKDSGQKGGRGENATDLAMR